MRMRIAQGLELPGLETERSQAAYFHDEAVFQLTTAKQHHGSYNESDAIAALHLVSYSQMSGCKDDWQRIYAVACEWVAQTGLFLEDSNPRRIFDGLSSTGQLIVKITLWIDVFSSLTLIRPPRYLRVCRQLLGGDHHSDFWTPTGGLRMDKVTGCPDEALLCIAETSALAHWKAAEKRNSTLSVRELIRRGDVIEQRLRQQQTDLSDGRETPSSPLHPALASTSTPEAEATNTLTEGTRRIVADLFQEAAVLYLHTVLSECNPGVPEIHTCVDNIVSYLNQIPPSETDRGLMFPICLAGAMTDDSRIRAFFKRRLALRDEGLGNIPHCRILVEGVWQKRDCDGVPVDLRETAQACNLNLLLV
ncbi:hypothetical protein BDN72DRAFT_839168 [Pluteus cervinus]|uniref:Uncharacterized protein n=1 Tax=Pluteus cervinus TaxID=181527 RepID=A0ACD3AWY4_9AGAR|nr:hypothetical protein BDN72DRAFT_839168 [Pluteus cervinus]